MRSVLLTLLLLTLLILPVSADTFIIQAVNDSYLTNTSLSTSWQLLRDATLATGTINNPSVVYDVRTIAHASTSGNYTSMTRYGITFPTSVSLSGYAVDSVILRQKYVSKSVALQGRNNISLVSGSPGNGRNFVGSDYNKFGTTDLAPQINFTTLTGDINFTLNSVGISYINTGGDTTFYIMDSDEATNSFSGTWGASANRNIRTYPVGSTSSADRPYLEVVAHISADTTPPDSITGLTNTTATTCNSINWT